MTDDEVLNLTDDELNAALGRGETELVMRASVLLLRRAYEETVTKEGRERANALLRATLLELNRRTNGALLCAEDQALLDRVTQ